ncbi:MAG TPA: HEAT repeat domain-containing protein [Vicinamibacterales bacterium]|nr:HEAT repeat domain-containing protein [Vicinamibacterales bacterium]
MIGSAPGAVVLPILPILIAVAAQPLASAQTSSPAAAPQQVERQDAPISPKELRGAIDQLGKLDFSTRMNASRTVRRASAAQAVPALIEAVTAHADGYVRFRALVLLSGFNDPRTRSVVLPLLADANDRVRASAYAWVEHNRTPEAIPQLLAALETEESEFVRPSLTRALAAYADDPRARDAMRALVNRGQDFFRSVAIEAIGDYKGAYASAELTKVAQLEGPLQDDAVLALGKIGDKRALGLFAELQRSAPRDVQPSIAAAICLLGVNCGAHKGYLTESINFAIENSGFQELLRPAVGGMAAIAAVGDESALRWLVEAGGPSRDPARAPIALGIGLVALRNPALTLRVVEQQPDASPAVELLREAFDMLEEDYEEEQFFVLVRRAYWGAAEDTPTRRAAGLLIKQLEF